MTEGSGAMAFESIVALYIRGIITQNYSISFSENSIYVRFVLQ